MAIFTAITQAIGGLRTSNDAGANTGAITLAIVGMVVLVVVGFLVYLFSREKR